MTPATSTPLLAAIAYGPLIVCAAIAIVSGLLFYLALRASGLRQPLTCVCGYSLEGNESGTCPECGRPAADSKERFERQRIGRALGRSIFAVIAAALAVAFTLLAIASRFGETRYTDCRAVLVPDSTIYQQAELQWRLSGDPNAIGASSVKIDLTLPSGVIETKRFGQESRGTTRVADWVNGLPIKTMTPPSDTPQELGRLVDTALGGAEVVVVDSATRRHSLLAMGSVVTREEPRWIYIGIVAITIGAAAVSGVWVMRRTLRLSEAAEHSSPKG